MVQFCGGRSSVTPIVSVFLCLAERRFSVQEFVTSKLDANLERAAGQDDEDVFAVIWTSRSV
jgi:hypothetical protein